MARDRLGIFGTGLVAAAAVAAASVALTFAVTIAIRSGSGSPPDSASLPNDAVGTTWDPPRGWRHFQVRTIPAEGGDVRMDPGVDYLLQAPEPITAPLRLRGGRNVVWIGGEIRIDDRGRLAGSTERRALIISDEPGSVEGRIVHLEGLLLHGEDLAEGIDTSAPTAVVQLQNIRVERVAIRGADDRDGTGGYPEGNHADIIQTWGGQRELRIDGLSASTNYQGLFLRESETFVGGPIRLRNVDIEMVETEGEDGFTYGGARPYVAFPGEVGPQYIDSGTVWIEHRRSSAFGSDFGRVAYRDGERLVPDPVSGDATFADVIYPTPVVRRDDLGVYATWPAGPQPDGEPIQLLDWSGEAPARIYSGKPPEGDYVPANRVGIGYTRR
jgi:hypothetical protein